MVKWASYRKKIPSHIKILGVEFEIVYIDTFKGNNLLGETVFCDNQLGGNQIRLKKNLSNKEMVSTYLHEVLHAISFVTNANLTETQVLALEKSVPSLLKPNAFFKGKKV